MWQKLSAHSLGPIGDALTLLLDAGKADGSLRPDLVTASAALPGG